MAFALLETHLYLFFGETHGILDQVLAGHIHCRLIELCLARHRVKSYLEVTAIEAVFLLKRLNKVSDGLRRMA
ncbi:hypothetical protein TUM17382_35980 [Shewanella algae]|nr:hypothetical protein TUM17382_35980 [Shewanella algae]